MSDDWVKTHMEKAQLAKSAAPDMFQRIKDRIQQDLITFHKADVLQELQFVETSLEGFAVSVALQTSQPREVVVTVERKSFFIQYAYIFPKVSPYHGRFLIWVDLEGTPRVWCRNGDEKPFADESEISEFLLMPAIQYVESQGWVGG